MGQLSVSPEQVVDGIERIARLPAIPTHDWCDRGAEVVARSLCSQAQAGAVAVGVGRVENGSLKNVEAVGIYARGGAIEISEQLRDALKAGAMLLANVRAAANGGEMTVAHVSSTPTTSAWVGTEAARLLASRALAPTMVGVGLLAEADPSRALWVLLASGSGTNVTGDTAFASVILLALLRRARLALSLEGNQTGEWLSPRECEILSGLVLGKSVRQIADETGRSAHTIHDHVKSLHRKLNASSRGELIARALGHVSKATRIRSRGAAA